MYLFGASKVASDFRRKCTPSAACGALVGYNSLYSIHGGLITVIGDGASGFPTHNERTEIRRTAQLEFM